MRILRAAEVRAADRYAIERAGIPGLLLMEQAAAAVARAAAAFRAPGGRAFVLCGSGNNGGDGYAAARLLASRGDVSVFVLAVAPVEKLGGDAATNAEIFLRMGGRVSPFSPEGLAGAGEGDVVIDALLGTGLSRDVEGVYLEALRAIEGARCRGARVIAVDLPSGVDADKGRVWGRAVEADATVTFGAWKPGLLLEPGATLAGKVEVVDIGWPREVWEPSVVGAPIELLREEAMREALPERRRESHKGSYGHSLVVAGSRGKSGAAALAALGALRGGAGLVTVACRAEVLPEVQAHAPEMMGQPLEGDGPLSLADADGLLEAAAGKEAVLIGPGIPRGEETGALIGRLLAESETPFVLDADALNALAGRTEALREARAPVVITPHPGEMGRLLGVSTAAVQADRWELARRFAAEHGCVVVLKGAGTVVAEADGNLGFCPYGNAGMATAGTGDVLAGLLAGLLAQGEAPALAARVAVVVHALAGDRVAAERGQRGLVASDLLEGVCRVWAEWGR